MGSHRVPLKDRALLLIAYIVPFLCEIIFAVRYEARSCKTPPAGLQFLACYTVPAQDMECVQEAGHMLKLERMGASSEAPAAT